MRKLIAFDDETLVALTLLSRNRMSTRSLRRFAQETRRTHRSEGRAAAKCPH
jgi:hypothetical protein